MSNRPTYHKNLFNKGMNKDLGPGNIPSDMYEDALNAVEITEDGDFLERSNERGTAEIAGKVRSAQFPFEKFRVIGHSVLGNEVILFSVSEGGTLSEIGIIDSTHEYVSMLTTDELNFSIEHEIDAVSRKYFNGDRVVYWTDDFNSPRILNLDDIPTSNISDAVDLFISQTLPVARFGGMLEKQGSITAGAYQFIPRYLDETLNPTFFGIITNPIGVNVEFREQGRSQYDGDVQGRETAKSIQIDVDNVDQDFEFLELIVIVRDGPVGVPRAFIMQRKQIQADTETFVFSGLSGDEEEIILEDLVQRRPSYTKAKCIEQIDNRLTLSNLESFSSTALQNIANQISMRYQVEEIEYQDSIPTTELTQQVDTDDFEINSVYFQPEPDEDTSTVKNLNLMVYEFTQDVDPATVDLTSVSLITVAITAGAFVNTRVTPISVVVSGNRIIADYGPTVDFSDETVHNFSDYDLIDTATTGHLPITTWGVGTDVDAISGGPSTDPGNGDGVTFYTGTGSAYRSQDTAEIFDTAGVITVDATTDFDEYSDSFAVYGTNHNTSTQGLFEILEFDAVDDSIVEIATTATGADPAGTPIIKLATGEIEQRATALIQEPGAALNDGYFDDYVDEALATDKRTFMRDENYSFGITFIFNNGGLSLPFHIPGRDRNAASVAIKDIPTLDLGVSYQPGEKVTWLGGVYAADAVTGPGQTPSTDPSLWNYQGATQVQEGWLGTYESEEQYLLDSGYPEDSGTGFQYSRDSLVRHHKMPSNEEEPFYRLDEDGRIFIRLLGLIPVWEDGGATKSINDLIDSSPLAGQISGFIIGREKRDSSENRTIAMQGIGQNMWHHQGGIYTAHGEDQKEAHLSNSYFFGKTRLNVDTGRIYGRHDRNAPSIGYGEVEQRKDLVQFYSPDISLLDREVPLGVSMKPVLSIKGKIQQLALVKNRAVRKGPRSGLVHLACSYNAINYLENLSTGAEPTVIGAFNSSPATETFAWAFTNFTDIQVPVCNYYNEGYAILNLGEGNILPIPNHSQTDVNYNMVIDKGEFGSGFNADNSFIESTWLSTETDFFSERALYNLVLQNTRQYGSLGSAVYTNCIVVTNRNEIVDPEDAIFFGGDIFISKFSYKNSGTWRWCFNSRSNPSRSDDNENKVIYSENARGFGKAGGEGEELRCLGYFFIESEVNCNWRHRQVEQQPDGSLTDIGAPFYPELPRISGVTQGTIEFPGIGTFTVTRFPDEDDERGVLDFEPSLGQATGYNKSYSAQDEIGVQIAEPFGFVEVTDYPNRTIYSDLSIEGQSSDRYRFFAANNFHDVPRSSGEIVNTFVQGNIFYHQTRDGLWRSYVNERTAIPSNEGEVVLGNGGMFPLPSKELLTIEGGHAGLQHQFGVTLTPYGMVWVDAARGKLFRLGGNDQIEELTSNGMISWFQENITPTPEANPAGFAGVWDPLATYSAGEVVRYNGKLYDVTDTAPAGVTPTSTDGEAYYTLRPASTFLDNPSNPDAQGIRLGYDKNLRRVMITKRDEANAFTLSYSLLSQSFISRHSYLPTRYFSLENEFYGIDNIHSDMDGLRVWNHNRGDYGVFYGADVAPMEITIGINPMLEVQKVYDNLVIISRSFNSQGIEQLNDCFDQLQVYTTNKHTGLITLDPALPDINTDLSRTKITRRNDEFRLFIPPDAVLDKNADIFDSANLSLSLPVGDPNRLYRPRIKGKYATARFIYLNSDNNKLVINSIISKLGINAL